MLLRYCLIHSSIIILGHLIFTSFLSMLRYRSIYVISMCLFFISIFVFIMINHIISWIQTHLFFLLIFKKMFYCFWMITLLMNVNNFQIAKVQPEGVVRICMIFWEFQLGVTYVSVAYKKPRNTEKRSSKIPFPKIKLKQN